MGRFDADPSDWDELKEDIRKMRAGRQDKFYSEYLEKLRKHENVIKVELMSGGYRIVLQQHCHTAMKHGEKLAYYPKANKLHLFKGNKWIKPGLKWIVNNILKEDITPDNK